MALKRSAAQLVATLQASPNDGAEAIHAFWDEFINDAESASTRKVECNGVAIVSAPGLIDALVHVASHGPDDAACTQAFALLASLAFVPENQAVLAQCHGLVEACVAASAKPSTELAVLALWCLSNLLLDADNRSRVFHDHPSVLHAAMAAARSADVLEIAPSALDVLVNLAAHEDNQPLLMKEPGLVASTLEASKQGGDMAVKAYMLLGNLAMAYDNLHPLLSHPVRWFFFFCADSWRRRDWWPRPSKVSARLSSSAR